MLLSLISHGQDSNLRRLVNVLPVLMWRANSNYHLLVKSKAHPYKATPLSILMQLSKHYLLNLACFTVVHCNQILLQLCCFWFPFSSFTLSIKILLYGPYLFNLHIKAVHHPYIGTEQDDSNPHAFRHWFLRSSRLPFRHLPKKQTHQDLHSHLIAKTSEHDNYSAYVGKFIFAGNCLSVFPVNHFTQGFLWQNLLSLFVFNLWAGEDSNLRTRKRADWQCGKLRISETSIFTLLLV